MSTDETDLLPGDEFPPSPGVSAAEETAALWLARLSSGEATDAERAAFARWRDADPAHAAACAQLGRLWAGLDRAPAVALAGAAPAPAAARPRARRRWRRWALAASLLLAAALGYEAATDWRHDAVTAAGERRSLALADGSRVVLSGDTALDVAIDAQRRGIALARGEVWLEVTPDAARPFVVRAGAGEVRVLGTRFAVRRDAGELRVVVGEGRVEVHAPGAAATLDADQRVTLRDGVLSGVVATDAARELAWQQGRLVLTGATLDEIVRELDRHHAGIVLIADPALRQRRFSTVIDLDRVDDWLTGLGEAGSIEITRLGPLVVLH